MEELTSVMKIIVYVIAFFLGASIFSFLEVMIIRIPQKRSFISGHSVCDNCGHELNALDMIPVFGWVLLGGKCRYCKAAFPPTSSIKEAAGGALFCLCLWRWGLTAPAFIGFICVCALNVGAFIALSQKKIHIPSAVTATCLFAVMTAVSVITSADKGKCAVLAAIAVGSAVAVAAAAWLISRAIRKDGGRIYVAWFVMCATLAAGVFLLK